MGSTVPYYYNKTFLCITLDAPWSTVLWIFQSSSWEQALFFTLCECQVSFWIVFSSASGSFLAHMCRSAFSWILRGTLAISRPLSLCSSPVTVLQMPATRVSKVHQSLHYGLPSLCRGLDTFEAVNCCNWMLLSFACHLSGVTVLHQLRSSVLKNTDSVVCFWFYQEGG